jgi:NTP pyrophosphatase (non-canonical NTP hydrolase)
VSLDTTTQDFIEWADSTIPQESRHVFLKTQHEFQEWVADPCAEEAADVYMCLIYWAHLRGINLGDAVEAKLAKNRDRSWRRKEDGTWQHV